MKCKHLKHLFAVLLLLCATVTFAHDFEVGGIYYNILSETDKTVEVTYRGTYSYDYSNEYTGSVAIPESVVYGGITYSVTSIGEYAFYACDGLQTVLLPDGIVSIGSSAFAHSGINSITIPASVVGDIDGYMFYECSSLNEIVVDENNEVYDSREGCNAIVKTADNEIIVGSNNSTIPAGIVSIGERAFDSRPGLKELILPNGFKTIGESAFRACSGLKKVYISETVTSVGAGAFGICPEIESIVVDKNNKVLDSREDCNAIIKTSTNTLLVGCQNTFIPTTITAIGSRAFFHAKNLELILIPSSVTSLGDYAFYGCSSLKCMVAMPTAAPSLGEYSLGDGFAYLTGTLYTPSSSIDDYKAWKSYFKTQNTISPSKCGDNLFSCIISDVLHIWGTGNMDHMSYDYDSDDYFSTSAPWYYASNQNKFSSIKIHHGVKSIGNGAFCCCTNFKSIEIPNSVTSIGERALSDCYNLTSITIPNSVTSIGNYAFYNCRRLTSITIPNSVTGIGGSAFWGCSGLTSIEIPNSVTGIGHEAFYECTGLTSITIPNSVKSIGYETFYGCTGLTSITIPNSVKSIGYNTFSGCTGLTSVEIPNSVTSIGESAFSGCTGLTSITIPNSVTSIGKYAFSGCTGLTSITIPNSVTSIASYAFSGCTGLTSITIPNSVTSIGSYAFRNCTGLTSVEIPNSVTSIGNYAFLNCTDLTSITIPNSVTSIGEYAFKGCTELTSIEIPNSVTSIGDYAFIGCSGLTRISVESGNAIYDSRNNCNAIVKTATNKLMAGCQNTIIPNSVKYIGSYAFDGCTGLTSIEIPNSVTSIERSAFSGCTGLTSVVIGNSVTSIGNYAFSGCKGLTSVVIGNSVTSIGSDAFNGCTGLTSITIPNSVTSIASYAFSGCKGLKTVINFSNITFSKGSSSNGYIAYYADKVLNVPNGFIDGDFVWFENEDGMTLAGYLGDATELILSADYKGKSVTSIGSYAFRGCTGLTSVVIPSSITSIEGSAFYGCTGLASITSLLLAEDLFAIDSDVFSGVDKTTCTLYVPYGAKETYAATAGWNEFVNIVELEPTEVTVTIGQYGNATYCSPYALDFSEVDGLKAYAATGYKSNSQVVTLTRVQTAEAGVGLFLKGEPGEYVVPVIESTDEHSLNMLVGTLEPTIVNSTDGAMSNYKFTIADGDAAPMFYPFEDGTTLSAGKAYLQIPTAWLPATAQKSLSVRFDEGETTDIDELEGENGKLKGENGEMKTIYDLSGRVVENPTSGIYIINGKKVVVK